MKYTKALNCVLTTTVFSVSKAWSSIGVVYEWQDVAISTMSIIRCAKTEIQYTSAFYRNLASNLHASGKYTYLIIDPKNDHLLWNDSNAMFELNFPWSSFLYSILPSKAWSSDSPWSSFRGLRMNVTPPFLHHGLILQSVVTLREVFSWNDTCRNWGRKINRSVKYWCCLGSIVPFYIVNEWRCNILILCLFVMRNTTS